MHSSTEIVVSGTLTCKQNQKLFQNIQTKNPQLQLLSADKNQQKFQEKQRMKSGCWRKELTNPMETILVGSYISLCLGWSPLAPTCGVTQLVFFVCFQKSTQDNLKNLYWVAQQVLVLSPVLMSVAKHLRLNSYLFSSFLIKIVTLKS